MYTYICSFIYLFICLFVYWFIRVYIDFFFFLIACFALEFTALAGRGALYPHPFSCFLFFFFFFLSVCMGVCVRYGWDKLGGLVTRFGFFVCFFLTWCGGLYIYNRPSFCFHLSRKSEWRDEVLAIFTAFSFLTNRYFFFCVFPLLSRVSFLSWNLWSLFFFFFVVVLK